MSRRPSRLVVLALVAGLLVAAGSVAATRPDGWTRLTVLDVGQGDAILVEGSSGGRVLVDGGPDPDRLRALLDARLPAWDRRLDVVILTHPHEDHDAGLVGLIGRYRIGRFYEPGRVPGIAPLRGSSTVTGCRGAGSRRGTASPSTTAASACCGPIPARSRGHHRTAARRSTTSPSCSS